MKTRVIFFLSLLKIDLLNFCRNKGAAFWTFAFPLLLLVIFMGSFGNSGSLGAVAIQFDDQDKTAVSADFIDYTRFVFAHQSSIEASFDPNASAEEKIVIVIPKGFTEKLDAHKGAIIRTTGGSAKNLA